MKIDQINKKKEKAGVQENPGKLILRRRTRMKRLAFTSIFCSIGCLFISVSQVSRGQATSQYPVADRVIKISDLEPPAAATGEAATSRPERSDGTEGVRNSPRDPQLRKHFLDAVAAPIVNKLFEPGFIP